jgi:hypothetical protein
MLPAVLVDIYEGTFSKSSHDSGLDKVICWAGMNPVVREINEALLHKGSLLIQHMI